MLPRILICGNIQFAVAELKEMFEGCAEIVQMISPDRSHFLSSFATGGPYERTIGIYRRNVSAAAIGNFDESLINALAETTSVRWIAQNGSGYDQIDVQACKAKGIFVSNTPTVNADATAHAALYLMLSCLRHFSMAERSLRAGTWKSVISSSDTHDSTGRTLGILGLGSIGLRLAHFAHAFPMRVVYHSHRPVAAAPPWCEYVESVEVLCREADVLSVHIPLNAETIGLIGEREIRMLKKGSILVNTARGRIVDEQAMIEALEDGHLSAVGLDTYPDEPHVNPKLLGFRQCALLPHVGGESAESEKARELRALGNLHAMVQGRMGNDVVPELRSCLEQPSGSLPRI
ncbi:D-isomer specific 2-hydroxyacid dehydrogenase [Melanogaster broomeanus]|nr:D-isomer specific 2-hydroxyacid dehydrogenase [Melanogaster broomeanus]